MAANVMEIYGSKVFNEHVMKERLPSATYKSLKNTLHKGAPLDIEVANVVASVMKRWAMELGATHYTHWFQPLTGITSEKHDGFVSPVGDGTAIMEFSGKELVRGEPDASSFPSGGLRATCEARGYTAWDPTSYAFVKDDVLCIPTAFVSYTGEALDKKTPLLRSMNALSGQAVRILKLFGKDVDYVSTTVGPEQEYFLVKKEDYEARQDLILTGRTLFGAPSAKGQELEEHYFGVIRPEVSAFMKELDEELWKLGVPAKTKHNEVAPCQHELAPIFDTTNVAIDHNLLTMEMMRKIAPKYGLVCLQHEKPFEGVNGSGKHNNWSMSTTHENLLDPGDTPMENLQFLIFLAAVIKAVDEYADLLRTSVATPGNDHRLGANEAPPAIISIFVGEELEAVIDAIASDSPYAGPVKMKMDLGVDVLPKFSKDTTDRNRTSPFAFTGNKFEFRMPGSAENLSDCNTILNTAVAKELKGYADELEGAEDFTSAAIALIKRTIRDHRRVIFNGNGYTAEWEAEAAKRGLPNKKNTPAALPALVEPKNIQLMEEFGVLTKVEMESRYEVEMEHYSKIINIEALTMLEMARKQLLPAINAYMSEVANTAASKLAVSEHISVRSETKTLEKLSSDADAMSDAIDTLQDAVNAAKALPTESEKAVAFHDNVLPVMDALRAAADDAETICGEVAAPGVYELPAGSRMYEAVEKAGGMTSEAAQESVNLAQAIEDGQQLRIPSREEIRKYQETGKDVSGLLGAGGAAGNGSESASQKSGSSAALINLNTASKEELMTLNGIGAARAEAILSYREQKGGFRTIEDIMKVPGIKNAAFQKIKDKITV